ncbi:cytochrome c oxidase assembly protein [Methyloceanibacter marginalis]|uniref:cytochrome c oxidase assembly protein n=1 Tax=Methyloceanibacter marginalis TaxID=1774971 RepID=UPI00084C33E0
MSRTVYLLGGLYLLAVAWFGPLPQLAGTSFAAHMGLHLILIAGAAPLIAMGLSGTRIDARLASLGLLNPILASVAELVVVWAWHAPGLHDASRGSTGVFVIEQASFLAVGLLLWLSAVGTAGGGERRAAIGVIGMLLTSMHMALLGALLNLAPVPSIIIRAMPPWPISNSGACSCLSSAAPSTSWRDSGCSPVF